MALREIPAPGAVPRQHPFACVRCWKLKKKCDRISSKCGRCYSLNVSCVYSSQPPTDRPEALRTRASNDVTLQLQLKLDQNAQIGCTPAPSLSSGIVSSNAGAVCHESSLPTVPKIRQSLDVFLSRDLQDAYDTVKPKLISICNQYLDTMNAALPILIDAEFRKYLSDLDSPPEMDVRTLLLSVYLVTKMPTQLPAGGSDLDNLYSALKPFYTHFTSTSRPSISIIQAGILIAIYEQGQAEDETAYLTLGLCARMGYAIGLHKSLSEDLSLELGSRDVIETHKHVWWSLIIIERGLALEASELNRPFVIKHPTLDDHLPSFCGRDVESFLSVGQMADKSQISEIVFAPANAYARSCQATYLLSRVFQLIGDRERNPNALQAGIQYLDKSLQGLSLSIINQSNSEVGVPWEYSCASWMLCMVALCSLHRYNLAIDSCFAEKSFTQGELTRASRVALHSFSRIAIDGAEMKIDHPVEGALNIPPFAIHFFREMAILVLHMGHEEGKKISELMTEISSLRLFLSVASQRWKLAGRHVQEIDKFASELDKREKGRSLSR